MDSSLGGLEGHFGYKLAVRRVFLASEYKSLGSFGLQVGRLGSHFGSSLGVLGVILAGRHAVVMMTDDH